MGILNVTPNSFFDSFNYSDITNDKNQKILDDLLYADIIDVGGESSRPGAEPISSDEEIRRIELILPLLDRFKTKELSIDTYHYETAKFALSNNFSIAIGCILISVPCSKEGERTNTSKASPSPPNSGSIKVFLIYP